MNFERLFHKLKKIANEEKNIVIYGFGTIGAGSVVTKDIPDNATAAGNYAKVLNFNNPGRFIKNRFEE